MNPTPHTIRHSSLYSLLVLAILLVSGCRTEQRYLYVEDAPHNTPTPITNSYDATIYPNDELYIFISSQSPESVKAFNQETNTTKVIKDKNAIKGYLVSQSGDIIFPVLGRLHVAGKTRTQLEREIESMLIQGGYVTDPVATVNLMNFHVTVIGEVKKPSVIVAEGSRLTIFEALAQCGDITMDGMRTNVVVVRSGINKQIVDTIDLTRKEVLNSPYYYLQQNDIVFVEPTPKKKRKAWRNEDWPQYLTIGVQSLRIAYVTIYRIAYSTK